MMNETSRKRGPKQCTAGPRFYFLLFCCSALAFGQADSSFVYRLSTGASYDDILRQTSGRSRSIVFSRSSSLVLTAVRGEDSLSLSYRTEAEYGSFRQQESDFSASALFSRQTISLGYAGRAAMFRYGITAGMPAGTKRGNPLYSVYVSTAPFGPLLSTTAAFQRSPLAYGSAITFLDFLVPLDDGMDRTTASYSIHFAPFTDASSLIRYFESEGTKPTPTNGYGASSQYHSIGKELSAVVPLDQELRFRAGASTEEFRMNLTLERDNTSFGNLTNGAAKHTQYTAGIRSVTTRLSADYLYEEVTLSGFGQIESWPFTSLASSIIANRLNYRISGMVKHHSAELSSSFGRWSAFMTARLSYHRFLTDAVLEHWEPELFVFGRKNYIADPIAMSDLQLLGIGGTAEIPISSLAVTFAFTQYIPVSISYRKPSVANAPAPAPAGSPASRPVTDGGRSAAFSVSYIF